MAQAASLGRALGVGLLLLLAALRIADPAPLEELRNRTFDLYQVLRPRVAEERPVIIVDIDEKSLARLGQWPWPRTRVAELVGALAKRGALAIGFDMIFPEPDRLSPSLAVEGFSQIDAVTRQKLLALPSNDQVFAERLRQAPVVLGQSALPFAAKRPRSDTEPVLGLATLGEDPKPFLLRFPGLLRNLPILSEAAPGHGVFTIRTERDGIVRRIPLLIEAQGDVVTSLSLEMLRVVTDTDTLLIKTDPTGIKSVGVKGLELPTDQNGQVWVHFAPHDAARFISAADVLDGRVSDDQIARKLVLVGTSAVGLLDIKTTPVDPAVPGVEVHAQVLESALTGAMLFRPSYGFALELAGAILVGLTIVAVAPLLSPFFLVAFGVLIAGVSLGLSWYLYATQGLLLDVTYPLLSSSLVYLAIAFSSYFKERAQRQSIRSAFGQYISPDLIEQLVKSPDMLVLGGEDRDMTIMFSDVRGFTGISETFAHDPQGLTALMNRLLTPLTNAIIANKGTIDKYMGDAIMAFWNAPLTDKNHHHNACEAAFDMLARIDALNLQRDAEAKSSGQKFLALDVGIGINSGTCVVGNMGSDLRFDYSVLGDPVNLASRLEGQSKTYGVKIILGEATASAVAPSFALIEIDLLQVKGKLRPQSAWTLLGGRDVKASLDFQALDTIHSDMLRNYRRREFDKAATLIDECRRYASRFRLEPLYRLYEERIAAFRVRPPPDDWIGVFSASTK